MSNGRVEEVGRNKLDISAAVVNKKAIIVAIVVTALIVVIIVALFLYTKKGSSTTTQTGLSKNPVNTESLQSKQSSNTSLDSMKNQIIEKEKAKQIADKKAQEEEVKRQQELDSKLLPPVSKPEPNNQQQAYSNEFRSDVDYGEGNKDKPLPKSQRIFGGNTLVEIDNSKDERTQEKDYLQGGEYADGVASIIIKRRYLLSAGTSLSCILKTKIVTSYPAITLCQIARDIYSDDGKTLLVRRGAVLQGEQKKAITQGIARVFVNWSTIKDRNILVRVDGLGTDGLGAAGLPAWIDTHFWERFGNSLLLSLIDDTMESVKNMSQKSNGNNGSITYDNTSDASQQQAAIALQNSINIAPTGFINQGAVISVIVPRNIDFSSVYEVN